MGFKVLSFEPASAKRHFKIYIRFTPNWYQWIIGGRAYEVLFYQSGKDWFQRRAQFPEFICDEPTNQFLAILRTELEKEVELLTKKERQAFAHLKIIHQ